MIRLHNPHLSDESSDEYCSELDDSQEASAVTYHAAEHLSRFLEYPSPPIRCGGTSDKTYARVLTIKRTCKQLKRKSERRVKKMRRKKEELRKED